MQENKINFDQLVKDTRLLLQSFIRTNEAMAVVVESNGDSFDGRPLIEEAKSLSRIIGTFCLSVEASAVITSTLKLVSERWRSQGSIAQAYEADALLERCEKLVSQTRLHQP